LQGQLTATFVIDGSPDNCYSLLADKVPKASFSSQLLSHSKNFGSFAAIRTGLRLTESEKYAVMAADLQEPPELILSFFEQLQPGKVDIVIGSRDGRKDSLQTRIFSSLFWTIFRKLIIKDVPKGGVDVFGCGKSVRDHLVKFTEASSSLIGQLFWVGFKKKYVLYNRQERKHGKSAWTFNKKINYLMDNIFAFTDLPIKALIGIGFTGVVLSFLTSIVIMTCKFMGMIQVSGYTAIMLAIFFFGAINVFIMGIVGTYAHRSYENSKNRPLAIIVEPLTFKGVKNE
jgi:glycosyltransferase involved in cell wall biosynthesis